MNIRIVDPSASIVDDQVLKYLDEHSGEISIPRTSRDLGIPQEEVIESISRIQNKGLTQRDTSPFVERMHKCISCKKTVGVDEAFCSYCGAKQIVKEELQDPLDLHTVRVADKMVSMIVQAKEHEEYSTIDELATMMGSVALGEGKPQDAQELSFQDQLRLLALVFEFTRDKVTYKGETFGEYVRWPWQTLKTGGDCDCKVVLLASLLASLAYRRMYLLVLPPGTYIDTTSKKEKRLQGHAILEVDLTDKERRVPLRLDPSCEDCDVDEISGSIEPFLQNFYRIPIIP